MSLFDGVLAVYVLCFFALLCVFVCVDRLFGVRFLGLLIVYFVCCLLVGLIACLFACLFVCLLVVLVCVCLFFVCFDCLLDCLDGWLVVCLFVWLFD